MQPSGSNVGNPRVNATNYDIVSRPLTVFSGPIFLADEWLLLAGSSHWHSKPERPVTNAQQPFMLIGSGCVSGRRSAIYASA